MLSRGQVFSFLATNSPPVEVHFVADETNHNILIGPFSDVADPASGIVEWISVGEIKNDECSCSISVVAKLNEGYVMVMALYCYWPAVSQICILTLRLLSILITLEVY